MSQHKDAATSAINRLFGRIQQPTASDARVRIIALKALDAMEPPAPLFDYDSLNMKEAREAVEQGKLSRAEALLKEKAGKNRATLVKWLEEGE